jgi:anion-transporting  ArsA/GET3 family ATPase
MLELDSLLDRKLLLITGKGGIGKTFISSCLAQYAAGKGRTVLIIQSVSCDQAAPYFEQKPGVDVVNLSGEDNFREYVVKYLGQKVLYDTVFSNKVVRTFIKTIPGFAEVMLLGRMFYTCELAPEKRYDLVIFDGWASGHFLSLMTTPDAVINSTLGGPLVKETARVREFLADGRKSGIVFVTCPEDLVVSETLDFLPKLRREAPAQLAALMVNRILTTPADGDGAAAAFVRERKDRAVKALQDLHAGLEQLRVQGIDMPAYGVREFPLIDLPLKPGFASAAFAEKPLAAIWGGQ